MMTAQLNVRITNELKYAVKHKCAEQGLMLEVVVTNLLADFVGDDIHKIIVRKEHPALIPPVADPIPGWRPEIGSVSFTEVDAWLAQHPEEDTSVQEVWMNCFHGRVRRNPTVKDVRLIGRYLQYKGWSKTVTPTSAYRVNRIHGRSKVFVLLDSTRSWSDGELVLIDDVQGSEDDDLLLLDRKQGSDDARSRLLGEMQGSDDDELLV